ncbi:MAG: 3-dehydroquinate synthase [Vicinamibacteria bacterium]|nr:3-dehydroquinate synthase [Vicinamibacteria bacterium]
MKRVRVAAGRVPYDVVIGRGALTAARLRSCLGAGASGVVLSSRRVLDIHGLALRKALVGAGFEARLVLLLPDGEAAKTPTVWARTMREMAKAGLDRSSFVIAFGGGTIGDAAGFAAATYMRGIRLIQVPTTLLSMVDSSVGGKTGVNLPEGKNLVGSFHQPNLVVGDLSFLRTLPERERQSGVYEVLKCGFLRSKSLVSLVERTRGLRRASDAELEAAIAEAVRIKARIVERDERESGERVLLNLGHTLGHALEAASSYRRFTHGEAVGYGMDFAVDLGEALGVANPLAASRMRAAIRAVGRRTPLDPSLVATTQQAVLGDKKRDGASLREILLARPQKPVVRRMDAGAFGTLAGSWLAAQTRRGSRSGPAAV